MLGRILGRVAPEREFARTFQQNLAACDWTPHPLYSVFTQYDASFYAGQREAFLHKYRCFWAVSRTIGPRHILELGTHAGSGADAYVSATPTAGYTGVDKFCTDEDIRREDDGSPWRPLEVAEALFKSRGFQNYEFVVANLRDLTTLPRKSDFVVVDAAHDFFNQYEDMKLALTAEPDWIFVDDVTGEAERAVSMFLTDDAKGRVDFTCPVEYTGSGLVIRLKS